MESTSHSSKKFSIQDAFHSFLKAEDKSKFFNKIIRTDYCWIWQGKKNASGYGIFYHKTQYLPAHRVSYAIYKGALNGLWVLHKCDHPDCVNPEHLFLGTCSDNAKDMFNKGRNSFHIYKLGDDRSNSKLTDEEVLLIHFKLKSHSSAALQRRFGVVGETIRSIRRGDGARIKRLLLELKMKRKNDFT